MKLIRYLKPYWWIALLTPVTMTGEVLIDLMQPKLMSEIVDQGVLGNNMELIVHTGLWMLFLVVIGGLCGVGSSFFSGLASQSFAYDLRNDVFHKVMDLSFEQTDRFTTGSLVTRMTNDITAVQQFVDLALRLFVRSILLFAGGIFMMLRLNLSFGLVLICSLPCEILIMIFLLKKAGPIYAMVQRKLDRVNSVVQENIAGARVVKAYVREDYESERFGKANDELSDTNLRVQKIMALLNPLLMIVMNLSVIAIIYVGGWQVEAKSIGVGEVMAAVTYITQILMSIMMVSMMFQSISRARASAQRLKEVLDTNPVVQSGTKTAGELGDITFDQVGFHYPGSSGRPVLSGFSFHIRKGENIAVLGVTGSGKSSLVHLIPRFYDVSSGEIRLGGRPIRDYELSSLREQIGMVLQKSELFSGSVAENIRWGRSDATDEEVRHAAEVAQADSFIQEIPGGYEGYIAEKGASLSGGQKQRLCIARAILKRPQILIFDDSTSALDLGTEARLRKALRDELKDTTIITIAQRIASVMNCDRIALLEDGRLAACGTHEELLASSKIYQDIYQSQNQSEEAIQ